MAKAETLSEPFSPQFCPRTAVHPWEGSHPHWAVHGAGLEQGAPAQVWGEASAGAPLAGQEGLSPLQTWTSACRRDKKQMGMSQARPSRGVDQGIVPRLVPFRAMDVCCLQAAQKELNSMIQQASAQLPGKLLCSEDLCQS